ncbi:low temperature requirement protein A [Aliidiomarina sanyensis]|uniref:Low temperature requirement protein A n=1 Tax=Aliidiomarina sanyensis TaxID=1249555 RepID=A0A432WKR3_9GAMM|nr:low temperature requirement protein A [Aliidiomarina sanyensis]RUO34279.1 hypothetical protein CWE11_06010 [Aliidiomarina sanyensis]
MPKRDTPIWRKPQHYMDVKDPKHQVNWVELFFDLVHVVTIFMLGTFLAQNLDMQGFWIFTAIFVAIFFAWADSSVYNALYISTDLTHRTIMAFQSVTMMVIAASIPDILSSGWVFFALGFATNRALLALLYWRAKAVGAEQTCLAGEQSRNFALLAVWFAITAFLPTPFAFWMFVVGLALIQLQYMLPRVGTLRYERFVPHLHHISERFGLLMLILIGEGFFKLVLTLSNRGIGEVGGDTIVNFVMGGLTLFALAWVYFDCVGNAVPKSKNRSVLVAYWLAHLVIMWSAIMVSVALSGEVYVGFFESYPLDYGFLGVVGLLIFIATLWPLQRLVEGRDYTRSFHTLWVRVFGCAVAFALLFIFPFVPAIVSNSLWSIALFSQIVIPLLKAFRVEVKAT